MLSGFLWLPRPHADLLIFLLTFLYTEILIKIFRHFLSLLLWHLIFLNSTLIRIFVSAFYLDWSCQSYWLPLSWQIQMSSLDFSLPLLSDALESELLHSSWNGFIWICRGGSQSSMIFSLLVFPKHLSSLLAPFPMLSTYWVRDS